MSWLELKVPPPVVALLVGLLMWLASALVAPVEVPFAFQAGVTVVLASVGVVVVVAGIFAFLRAGTTIKPTNPGATTSLVTGGVFRFSRNPMYLGLLLFLIAWAVYLLNGLALILVPVFVIYMNRFQIEPEERALSSLFGPEYTSYQARVRRWL